MDVMARWRAEAIKLLPELRKVIAEAGSVMSLWTELCFAFGDAYEQEPRNESLIARIYTFADWCEDAPDNPDASHDPLTAVIVGFYEDIPTCRAAREDMPRWFTFVEVSQNRETFGYHLSEEEWSELLRYMSANRKRYRPWRKRVDRGGGKAKSI